MDNTTVDKRSVLLVATVAAFLAPFMGSSVNVALPTIGRQFGLDAANAGDTIILTWVTTAYLLVVAMSLVPLGRMADIYGRRRLFLYGVSVYGFSTILSAASTSIRMLIACRAVEGLGGAMIFGSSTAILISVFPPAERGKVLGINVAAVYVGLSAGPFLGGLLTQHLGWRSIFLATMPLAVLILLLALWKLRGEWAEARCERFDYAGAAIYGAALVSLMYGISRLMEGPGPYLALAGVGGLAAFIWWEARAKSPVLDLALFRHNPVFAFSSLAAFLNYSATYAVTFLVSLYLQYVKALTPQQAGLVLVAQPVVQASLSPLTGRLSDRVEPRIVASAGMGLTAAGVLLLTSLSEGTPLAFIVASLVFLGLGFALFSSPNTNAAMSAVERKRYSVASGILGTMRSTGQMFSMGLVMLVFAIHMGTTKAAGADYGLLVGSIRIAFGIFAVLCTFGIFASLSRGKMRREQPAAEEPR